MQSPNADEAARLLAIADQYFTQANAARLLASAIDRRRHALKTRLDPCIQRHLPDVWSSNAAEISRTRLTRMVARDLWIACEQLFETRTALMHAAEEAETQGFVLQNRASKINAVTASTDNVGESLVS